MGKKKGSKRQKRQNGQTNKTKRIKFSCTHGPAKQPKNTKKIKTFMKVQQIVARHRKLCELREAPFFFGASFPNMCSKFQADMFLVKFSSSFKLQSYTMGYSV